MKKTNILLEELSVSDEVLKETEIIRNQILDKYQKENEKFINVYDVNGKKTLMYKSFSLTFNDLIFNTLHSIIVNVVNFDNPREFSKYQMNFDFGGETTSKYENITLIVFSFNGTIDEKYLNSTLFHEMHHIYQNYVQSKSKVITSLYNKALHILSNKSNISKPIIDLSQIIYAFNRLEIDANMQSLYQELKTDKRPSEVLMSYDDAIKRWNELKELKSNIVWKKTIKNIYNIDFKVLIKYIDKNIRYYNEKKNRVFKRLKKEKILESNPKSLFGKILL